jgi:diguanylate cyclase (GGDEF)-like protein
MSLRQQMVLFISSLMLILLLGTFLLNLANTKNFLEEQLTSHAQDTATSLGLSLSTVADPSDLATMETMINAIFDRGYYLKIALKDQNGKLLYQRENPNKIEGVPQWFIRIISIEAPTATSLIQAGWFPVGTLEVTSHPGYAYVELWKALINLLIWFATMAFLAIGIIFYALKLILQPLNNVEKQAEAIVRKEYLVQDELPAATELRRVVLAMNGMVQKMKEIFERDARNAEKLQRMAYQDPVTGFSNRLHFEMRYDNFVDPDEPTSQGFAWMLRINNLKELNERYGYLVGDKVMAELANAIREAFAEQGIENGLYARLNGTEIIALLPHADAAQIRAAAERILQSFKRILKEQNATEAGCSIHTAYTQYHPGQSRAHLMTRLDQAIEQAKALGDNQVYFLEEAEEKGVLVEEWQKLLDDALAYKRFKLYQQTAYDLDHHMHDTELFIRMIESDGSIRSAGYFMPMAERLGKVAEIDRFVIQTVLERLKRKLSRNVYAINVNQRFIESEADLTWLLKEVAQITHADKHLAIEINESLIHALPERVSQFVQTIRQNSKIQVGIDHVGAGFRDQYYLMDIVPNYVKLDGAFAKSILHEEQTQTYVNSLAELAKGLDIETIAMSVETEEQAYAFMAQGVHFCQGYLFGAPKPFDEIENEA